MKPLFRTLLKQALDEANAKFLQGEGYKKTVIKKLPLASNTVEEINKVAKEIGLPLSKIHISEDDCDCALNDEGLYAYWSIEVDKSKEEIAKEKRERFASMVFYILQPLLLENGFKRGKYDHVACDKFAEDNNIIVLLNGHMKKDYDKIFLYDLYLEDNYDMIEKYYRFFYTETP